MTESCDALTIAVNVISAALHEDDVDYGTDYMTANIFRLLSGGGWMVTFSRTHMMFDHELEKLSA